MQILNFVADTTMLVCGVISSIFIILILVYAVGRLFGLGFSKSMQDILNKGDKKK